MKDARIWFRNALAIDPGSAEARERGTAVRDKSLAQAEKLWIRANALRKSQERDLAIGAFRQILDLLLPDDDLYQRAAKELEALKP